MYEDFLRSHALKRSEILNAPFVYVESETGSIRFLTNLASSDGNEGQILALTMGQSGDLELLSTEE